MSIDQSTALEYLADVESLLHQAASPNGNEVSEHDFFAAKEKIKECIQYCSDSLSREQIFNELNLQLPSVKAGRIIDEFHLIKAIPID